MATFNKDALKQNIGNISNKKKIDTTDKVPVSEVKDKPNNKASTPISFDENIGNSCSNVAPNVGGGGQKGDHESKSEDKDKIKRKKRKGLLIGKISSFMHKSDLESLKKFIEDAGVAYNNNFINHINKELDRIEARLKKLVASDKEIRAVADLKAPSLQEIFDEVKDGEGGQGSPIPYIGGSKDSDGINKPKRKELLSIEDPAEDTELTAKSISVFKAPYVGLLNRFNEIQYTGLKLIHRYYVLSECKFLLDDEKGYFSSSKSNIEDILSNLDVFFNVIED